MQFSREDIRKIIYYNWKRGLSTLNNHKEINCILGEGTVGLRTCSDWVAKFNSGNFVCEDEPRSGRPSYNLEEEILTVLKEDPRATTRKLLSALGVTRGLWKTIDSNGKALFVQRVDTICADWCSEDKKSYNLWAITSTASPQQFSLSSYYSWWNLGLLAKQWSTTAQVLARCWR